MIPDTFRAIDECQQMLETQVMSNRWQTKRLIAIYRVKLAVLIDVDVEENIDKAINLLIREGDPIGEFRIQNNLALDERRNR